MEHDRNKRQERERWRKAGYFFVVDADGAEVAGTRREIEAGMDRADALAIADKLERGIGPDCSVEFREA